jgi:phosphate-selective porin OprO and OprP
MQLKKNWGATLFAGALLSMFPCASQALTMDERMAVMEKRMLELEHRLEKSESENSRLRKWVSGQSLSEPSVKQGAMASENAADPNEVKVLHGKIESLERKIDQDKKAAVEVAKNQPKLELGPTGLTIKSADDNYRLNLRGYAQGDGNFFMDDSSGDQIADSFGIRRARLTVDGSVFKWVDFRFSPDFGQGNPRLFDAYVDLHYFPYASLMAGKMRPPVNGLERQQGAPNLALVERGLTQNLTPVRDIGVMLHGELPYPGYAVQYSMPPVFREFFGYQLGVFNGARDGANLDGDKDDSKEFAGRLTAHPFLHSGVKPLQGLGLNIAGSWGQPVKNSLGGLRSAGQQTFLSYKDGVTASGDAYRITPGAYWYYGPVGALTEYVISSQALAAGKRMVRQDNTAWQVALSYVLTGEDNSFQGVRPAQNFDPFAGSWGALQLAGRWSELDVDGDTFKYSGLFADPAKSARKATEWALGLNWYPYTNIKLMADYSQTYFKGGAAGGKDRAMEKVFQTRFQYQF